jgi:hypothetical protein
MLHNKTSFNMSRTFPHNVFKIRRNIKAQKSGNKSGRAHGGFLKPQHSRTVPLERQQPLYFVVPDPKAAAVSKALPSACPIQETQGAGVVNEAKNPIVAAEKTPCALYIKRYIVFWESPVYVARR